MDGIQSLDTWNTIASADAFEVRNISKVSISQKNDINLRILYDKTNSMEDKYLREQFSIGWF